jgi:hypothetical protein
MTEPMFDDCAALRAAYRAARAVVDRLTEEDVPDGTVFDSAGNAEVDARDAVIAARCANDGEFIANLECAFEVIGHDPGEWHETAAAIVARYLVERRQA